MQQAIFTAVQLAPGRLAEPLLAIGLNERRPAELRVAAFRAAAGKGRKLPETGFAFLRRQFDKDDAMRRTAWRGRGVGAIRSVGRAISVASRHCSRKPARSELSWLLQAFAQSD